MNKKRSVGLRRCLRLAVLLVIFSLAACSSLPTIVPDLGHRRPGALQRAGTQPTLASPLLAPAPVPAPFTPGNRVLLLQDGPATYRAMLAAMADATDHIHLETYILDDDAVGQQFAQLLIDKRRAGVQVSVLHDSAGTFGTPAAFFGRLKEAGVQVLEFNPVNPLAVRDDWAWNQRDHRKLLIVDGRIAFLGGINISSVHSGGSFGKNRPQKTDQALAWRDTDLQLQGPVVAQLQKLFIDAWAAQEGPPLAGRQAYPPLPAVGGLQVRAVGSSPEEAYSQIYATLLEAIAAARRSVSITNAYFAPDPQLLAALEAAAARGVDVRIILPSQTDNWLVFHAGRSHYTRLLRAGVKLFERRGVILHSKTALIDGVWATVGSTNLDWRSFLHNHELNAVVLGAEFGAQVQAMFDKDLAASDAVDLQAWQSRSPALRVQEWFGRLWEYWL